jgi:hypothetical protein
MAWSFNPFTGNLDITGSSGAVVFEGEVATFADLPVTIGDPAVGAAFLVRDSTGVWLVNRRQAGIYIRRNNAGLATDWEYAGDYPVNSVNGQSGNVVLSASSVGAAAATHASTHHTGGTDAIAPNNIGASWAQTSTSATLADGSTTTISAARNLLYQFVYSGSSTTTIRLPSSGNVAGDQIVVDWVGGGVTGNIVIERFQSASWGTVATIVSRPAKLTFRFTTSWLLLTVDTHTHAAADVTTGTFDNARINFAAPPAIGNTTPAAGTFTTLAANNGTLTASALVLDLAQTWNASGTTFTALNLALTNTASASASSYFNINLDGGEVFSIRRGESSVNATLIRCGGSGLRWTGRTRTGGGVGLNFGDTLGIGTSLEFLATASGTAAGDVALLRDGASDTLAQRRSTNAQTFRIYNTYTDATNHERLRLAWASNVAILGTEKGSGGGTARDLVFQTDGTTRMTIAGTSNAITCAGSLSIVTNLVFQGNSSIVGNVSSGVIRLLNAAQNGFDRIQFGGSTTSFPALKRDSTALQARLANDSDFCPLQGQLRIHQNAVSETITATHTLTLFDAAGTAYKVPCVAA